MQASAQNDQATTPREASSPPLRILVVDDEPDTVTSMVALLRGEGYEAQGHGSGQDAIDALGKFRPDVIISDIAMPHVDGWALAREVMRRMGADRPVLIAITGQYLKSSDKVLSHTSGFHFYLTKPAEPSVLFKLIETARPAKE